MDNKLALEALNVSHQTATEQLNWLQTNRARILQAAALYQSEGGQTVPVPPHVGKKYNDEKMRIGLPLRFLNNQYGVLAYAVKNKRPTHEICELMLCVIKQLV